METQNITPSTYLSRLSQEEVDMIARMEKKWHRVNLRIYSTYSTINFDSYLSRFTHNEDVLVIDVTKFPWVKKLGVMNGRVQVNGMTPIISRHKTEKWWISTLHANFIGISIVNINGRYIILVDYNFHEKERINKIADINTKKEFQRKILEKQYNKVWLDEKEKSRQRVIQYEYSKYWNEAKEKARQDIKYRKEIFEKNLYVFGKEEVTEVTKVLEVVDKHEAVREAEKIISDARLQARSEAEKIISDARLQARNEADKIISEARLSIKIDKEENERLLKELRLVEDRIEKRTKEDERIRRDNERLLNLIDDNLQQQMKYARIYREGLGERVLRGKMVILPAIFGDDTAKLIANKINAIGIETFIKDVEIRKSP